MTRKATLILFGPIVGVGLATGITIKLRQEKPVFGRSGIQPTLRHWYYTKHLHAFRCEDDPQAQGRKASWNSVRHRLGFGAFGE